MGSTFSSDIPIKWWNDFEETLPSLAGKTVVITGTTSGTGHVAAWACLKKGAEVFVLNRDSERAVKSLAAIQEKAPSGKITQISCDLQDFASVRKAAEEVNKLCEGRGLDVLCCNAGIMAQAQKETKDGFEVQMQTNQISHFLLVKNCLPSLKVASEQRGDARVVMHSSSARNGPPLEAKFFGKSDPAQGSDGESGRWTRYHQSKLANIVFTYALQDRLDAAGLTKIRCLTACPGAARTSLIDNSESWVVKNAPGFLIASTFQSAEDGTIPLMTCMVGPDAKVRDFILPSQGMAGEMKGPPKTLVLPPLKGDKTRVEAVCGDTAARDVLWKGCEEAIAETFVI